MINLFAAVFGLVGMFGLWSLAWLVVQPVWSGSADSTAEVEPVRRVWINEPTPDRTTPMPPPEWLFEDTEAAADPDAHADADADADRPARRSRPDSVANTVCFRRGDLGLVTSLLPDKTDVLPDEPAPAGFEPNCDERR